MTPEHHRYDVAELPWSLVRTALAEELKLSEDIIADIEVCIFLLPASTGGDMR